MGETSLSDLDPEQLRDLLSVAKEPDACSSAEKGVSSGISPQLGSWIDQYKLVERLGEGGMAVVYLAEQEYPVNRKVAIKIIRPGMNSAKVITRFEAERQTLTFLNHPNIAQIYEAGTTKDGLPYFVMEYVKGLPITEYCDNHKLTVKERLRLFQQVCHAVQHAHQKGIIHRDIKPSNIIVSMQDDHAVPKIIDFGIAKAIDQPLTERTLVTEDSQLLGTPEYMSLEQADMATANIDTRTDVFSLGVLLYVLLAGALPFEPEKLRDSSIENIRKTIRETDPKTPSTRLMKLGEEAKTIAQNRCTDIQSLAKHLHKELEWIPLKAMRKERSQRYRSASEFADDIENYLNGAPLIAGPLSNAYRFKKFIRRNRALVTGIAAVLAVLVAGVVVSTLFALRAQRQARISNAVSSLLLDDLLASVDPARGKGRDVTIRSFLDTTSESLDSGRFKDEPLVEALIRNKLGWTYRQLGELKAAEPHLKRALQIRREQLGSEHPETLESVWRFAWLRMDQGRNTEAAELLKEGLPISRHVLGDEHIETLRLANALGLVYFDLGRYDEAEQLYLKNIPIALRLFGDKNDVAPFMVGNLGTTYAAQGRYEEAERQFLEALRLGEGFWDDQSRSTLSYKKKLARLYGKQKRYDEATRLYLEILPIQRRVLGDEHGGTLDSMNGLARVYTHLGEYAEAQTLLMEVLEFQKLKLRKDHPSTLGTINDLGVLRREQERYEEAESLLKQAIQGRQRELGDDHPDTLESKNDLAMLYKKQGDYAKAEPLLLEALKGRRLKLGDTHPHTLESRKNLIELYEAWGKPEKAEEWRAKLPQTEAVDE